MSPSGDGMPRGEEKPKRWQFNLRGLVWFITAIAVSLAMLATVTGKPHAIEPLVKVVAILIMGGAIGGLCGQLKTGTREGIISGILVGGIVSMPCCIGLAFMLLFILPRRHIK
jgi:hypothetical protein